MRSVPHSVESISYDNKIFILIQDTLMTYFNNGYIGIQILFEKNPSVSGQKSIPVSSCVN